MMNRYVKWVLWHLRLRRYKVVKVYLRSGQTVKLKCDFWEIKGSAPVSGENGLKSYNFEGVRNNNLWFNIDEIVAVEGEY